MDLSDKVDRGELPLWGGVEDVLSNQASLPAVNLISRNRSFRATRGAQRGRILVVDDNHWVRETISELLEMVGFEVIQAGDAIEALACLREEPAIDAMVTDLTMPGDDGITLILKARAIRSGLPAILLTGYSEQVSAGAIPGVGDFDVLHKPVEGERLIDQLDLLVGQPAFE